MSTCERKAPQVVTYGYCQGHTSSPFGHFNMCAGTSWVWERNKEMLVAGSTHIHHCIPRCCQGSKQDGAQCSRVHLIGTVKRGGEGRGVEKRAEKARNKEGFSEVVTYQGCISADVSQTPHGPVLTPLPLSRTWTLTTQPTHTNTHSYREGEEEEGGRTRVSRKERRRRVM